MPPPSTSSRLQSQPRDRDRTLSSSQSYSHLQSQSLSSGSRGQQYPSPYGNAFPGARNQSGAPSSSSASPQTQKASTQRGRGQQQITPSASHPHLNGGYGAYGANGVSISGSSPSSSMTLSFENEPSSSGPPTATGGGYSNGGAGQRGEGRTAFPSVSSSSPSGSNSSPTQTRAQNGPLRSGSLSGSNAPALNDNSPASYATSMVMGPGGGFVGGVTSGGAPAGSGSSAAADDGSGSEEKEMDSWRLALLGDGGVGKTALAVQTYDPTIEDAYRKSTKVGNQRCFIEIIDTAGQDEYAAIRNQWCWETAGFILVFSLASYRTFDRLKLFYELVLRVQRNDPVIILVGNKSDQKRVVSPEVAIEFARQMKASYIETSAKGAHNVPLVFTEPITRLRNKHAHVAPSFELRGRLPLPLNPQSIEVPPGAIAAIAAQEAAKRQRSNPTPAAKLTPNAPGSGSMQSTGVMWNAPMPLNQLLLGKYPDGPTDQPEGYGKGGQTGPSIFEDMLPPGFVYPQPGTVARFGGGGSGSGGAGSNGGRMGRSRSGTNASASGIPHNLSGGASTPPLPARGHHLESGPAGRKLSDPSAPGSKGDKASQGKKKSGLGLFAKKSKSKGDEKKDGGCIIM